MKDDVPLPDAVPRKRRQIEALLDLHIAIWLASDFITDPERRRLQAEKDRRKALTPRDEVVVFIPREGMTPPQKARVREVVAGATTVHWTIANVGSTTPSLENTRAATRAVGAPKEMSKPPNGGGLGGVWSMIRYAKHRKLPVTVILPDGNPGEA